MLPQPGLRWLLPDSIHGLHALRAGETQFQGLRNVRLGQKIVQPLSADEIKRLLGADYTTPYLEARNRAIIWLLLDTGQGDWGKLAAGQLMPGRC